MSKTDNKNLLVLKNIFFGYQPKKLVLNNISLFFQKGEHICIVGANGCGKSTLLKIIVGLFKPTKGRIIFNGKIISNENVRLLKSSSGYVFENPNNQFIGMSVADEIAFGLENNCVPRSKIETIIQEVSSFTGIKHLLDCSVNNLSGGEKQIVAIASALATTPVIVAFDEVTSMLDGIYKQRVKKLINLLKRKKQQTIISITHDMEEAAKADRIIVMNKGKIVLDGKPQEIFKNKNLKAFNIDKPLSYKVLEKFGKNIVKGIDDEK